MLIKNKIVTIFSFILITVSLTVVAQNLDSNKKESEYYIKKYNTSTRNPKNENTIEYCLNNKNYKIKHLWIREESSFKKFLENADKFKNIDSLTIGGLEICDLMRQWNTKMFEKMPADLPDLPKLSYLNISVCSLLEPFTKFSHLKNLKLLTIIGQYENIPEEIWQLKQLEKLDLYGDYTTVSPALSNLRSLKELSLKGNWTELPQTNAAISGLKFLKLEGAFNKIPAFVFQNKNLFVLQLRTIKPLSVNKEIANLKNLAILNLSKNYIESIHNDIGKLEKLEELYFSCSWIESIPESICDLPNLRAFGIDNICVDDEEMLYGKDFSLMPLFKVPKNIQRMKKLETFDLYDRKVSDDDLKRLIDVFGKEKLEYYNE
jgi:Leucine-rich repeat (LRR) protein